MKTVPPPIQAQLDNRYGTEPILILEVEWVEGSPILYSDRKINDASYPHPTLLKLSGFDSTITLDGTHDSMQLKATLDDVDGNIKAIINVHDVHKRPAKIYLIYPGVTLENKMFLYSGQVVTPFKWEEGKRHLSFTILTELESPEVGFSMEEGEFPSVPSEARGVSWPLVFGTVCHIPTPMVRSPRRGRLENGTGIHDFTLNPRICQARKLSCKAIKSELFKDCMVTANTSYKRQECLQAEKTRNIEEVTRRIELRSTTGRDGLDADELVEQECLTKRRLEICRLKQTLADQKLYEQPTLNIDGGDAFPQGEHVTLFIDGAIFEGVLTGNSFEVLSRKHPAYDSYKHQACQIIPHRSSSTYSISVADAVLEVVGDYGTYYRFIEESKYSDIECLDTGEEVSAETGGPSEAWKTYGLMTDGSFFWIPAGTEVFLVEESEELHITSLIYGQVDSVCAYKTYADGRSLLTEIPPDLYTLYRTDYGDYYVTEIGLSKRLSLQNEWYSDDIYVSFTSNVGPNAVDIITWIVEKYTDLTIDTVSFEAVRERVEKYPCNFYLLDRPKVFSLLHDIARQSRCALFVRNEVISIVYLPIEPSSPRYIGEDDILSGSFKELITRTEDIENAHTITWKKAGASVKYSNSNIFKIILKYNVEKYGTEEREWQYYTQNTFGTILKSATFWLIRMANSWREVKFETPLKHIALDVGDAISLDIPQFSANSVTCIITEAQFNPNKNLMQFRCWTPIRTGESEPYYWAWPSQQSEVAKWPLPGDPNGDQGYADMSPPEGHLLGGGVTHEDNIILTTGDEHPSDLDDIKPVVTCEVSEDLDVDEMPWRERAKAEQVSAHVAAIEAQQLPEEFEEAECGFPKNLRCGYMVKINWHMPYKCSAVAGQTCDENDGYTCGGINWTMCHTFGAPTIAKTFWRESQLSASDFGQGNWTVLEPKVLVGDIHRDITEGRMVTEVLGFQCERLWCDPAFSNDCGSAEPFQHQGEFGEAIKQDCSHWLEEGYVINPSEQYEIECKTGEKL